MMDAIADCPAGAASVAHADGITSFCQSASRDVKACEAAGNAAYARFLEAAREKKVDIHSEEYLRCQRGHSWAKSETRSGQVEIDYVGLNKCLGVF
jgi:hypothetical protein